MWGVHFYAFFGSGVLWLSVLLLVVACGVLFVLRDRLQQPFERLSARLQGRGLVLFVVAVCALGTLLFWTARTTHTYLGDGNVLVASLPSGQSFHERQPLTMALQQLAWRVFGGTFEKDVANIEDASQNAVAVGSVITGLLFLVVAWFLAREIVRFARADTAKRGKGETAAAIVVWLILAAQGYMQLFFGYVENYSFYTVGITLYLLTALLYLRGAVPLLLPGLALLFGIALHLSTVVMAPSFVVLVALGLVDKQRRTKVAVDTAIVAAAFIGLHLTLNWLSAGYSLTSTLLEVTGLVVTRRHEGIEGYMFSGVHLRDFFNEQFLIGPLGLWLLLPALVVALASKLRTSGAVLFLAAASLTYVAASWIAGDSNLGYARNWDLLAPGAVVFTAVGLALFLLTVGQKPVWGILLAAFFVSLFHTVPWIATNALPEHALARLKTLPLGYGRTEVLVSQWYRREGDAEKQRQWLEQAIRVNEYNNNAQYLLGLFHYDRANYELSAKAFSNAAQLRPDKVLFREYLVQAYFRSNQLQEAIPHLEFLIEKDPNRINNWILYAEALKLAGRPDDARRAFQQTEPIYRAMLDANPNDYTTNLGYGWMLYNLEDYEAALPFFEKSVSLNPASADGVCYIGFTLRRLGREQEAAARFAECLEINPRHPDRAEIESWLNEIGRPLNSPN